MPRNCTTLVIHGFVPGACGATGLAPAEAATTTEVASVARVPKLWDPRSGSEFLGRRSTRHTTTPPAPRFTRFGRLAIRPPGAQ